jgi:AcrR family transcriptional regulator
MAVDTKERIYEAAVKLFYELGYAGTTIRDICARAGVQPPSVYYHYQSKQGLLHAVLKRATLESTEWLESRIEGIEAPDDRLVAAIRAHVEWHTSRQLEAFVADAEIARLDEPGRIEMRELRRAHEQVFRDIIDAGVASGQFGATKSPVLTRMLMSGATGVSAWYRDDGEYDPATIAAVLSDALLQGLDTQR